jgi:DNA-binding SARP family transcriptional activator/tetratricopeptide (TPR) repeat protein
MRFRVLGPVGAVADGRPVPTGRPRQQAILGFLLLNRNSLVSTDSLVTALWEDNGPSTARNQVQTDLSILRRLIRSAGSPDLIRSRPTGYTIELADGQLDLDDFTAKIRAARQAADPAEAAGLLRSALAQWTGTPLGGIRAPYAAPHRVHLEEQRLQAHERLFDLELRRGRHAEATSELFGLLQQYPLRERLVGQLMTALYRDGRQLDALKTARSLRFALAEQYGLDPGRGLVELEQAILSGDPELDLAAEQPAKTRPPSGAGTSPGIPIGRGPVPKQLPRDLHGMTGRPDQLARLGELLDGQPGEGGFAVVVLTGMAGAGKTTLAVHFAHRIAGQFPDGQLYVNLRGFDANSTWLRPADVLRGFLVALGEEPQRLPDDQEALAGLYRTRMAGRRMFVVLDNARDAEQVRPLLPGDPRCAVLVTSRSRLLGLIATDAAEIITVAALTTEQALDLMASRLGPERVNAEPRAAASIAAHCGMLPLALAIVTANAASQPAVPLATIARDLLSAHPRLGAFSVDGEPADVATIFSWSCSTLSEGAARLFQDLGSHPIPEISFEAAASLAGLPRPGARALLAELAQASLITECTEGRFTMHDLLHAYASEQSRRAGRGSGSVAATQRLADHYLHSAILAGRLFQPGRKPLAVSEPCAGVMIAGLAGQDAALRWLQNEDRALIATVTQADGRGIDRQVWQLAWCLSAYLHLQGRRNDSLMVQHAAVEAAGRLGDPHARAFSHRGLGQALTTVQDHAEAELQFQLAEELFAEIGDLTGEALVLQMRADLHSVQGHHRKALAMFRRALQMYEDGGNILGRAAALNNTAVQYVQLGRYREALAAATASLAVYTSRGDAHGAAAAYDTIGSAHHGRGELGSARLHFGHALRINRDAGQRYIEASTLQRLSEVHVSACDRAAAISALEQALAILQEIRHPDAVGVQLRLARLS